jgi:hypothetical protein
MTSRADDVELARSSGQQADGKYGTGLATIDDVALLASQLPEVTDAECYGNRTWYVAVSRLGRGRL